MLKDLIKNAQSPWTIGAGDDKDVVLFEELLKFKRHNFHLIK